MLFRSVSQSRYNELISEEQSDALYERKVFIVDKGQEPYRIDKWVQMHMEGSTRNKVQQGIEAGFLTVNGKTVKSNYKIKPGDEIVLMSLVNPEHTVLKEEPIPLNIVYEDDALLVINKPAGMVVHPGHGNYSGTLVNALAYHFENLPMNSSERPGLVHRIDKDTSGLLVVAKTDFAMAYLTKQFAEKTSEREYVALVWGNIEEDEGTIEGNIDRHNTNRMQMAVFPDGEKVDVLVYFWLPKDMLDKRMERMVDFS